MKTLLALAAATGLLLVAGCGEDAKEDYAKSVDGVLVPLGDRLQELGPELSQATSTEELAAGIQQTEDRLQEAVDELEGIDPPEDVGEIHSDLIAAIEDFKKELGPVRKAAEDEDAEKLQSSATSLPAAATELQTKLEDIEQRAKDAGVPIEDSSDE